MNRCVFMLDGSLQNISVIKRCSAFLTAHLTRQILQTLVLLHLDYCPVISSSAAKKDPGKLQMAQNNAARLYLGCTLRSNVDNMQRAEERLTASLLVLDKNINVLIVCTVNFHLAQPHIHIPPGMPLESFKKQVKHLMA